MTLIAGLVCDGSIVFAADSEESSSIRRSVEKVQHNKGGLLASLLPDAPSLVIAGAGNGALVDYTTQKIMDEVPSLKSTFNIEAKIEEILEYVHRVKVPLHPQSNIDSPEFELLIGMRSPAQQYPVLYSTHGATLVRRETYFICGTGALAEFILDQLYSKHMPTEDAISASLYMLQLAKKYVPYVGGKSQVTILRSDGRVDQKPFWEIREEENLLSRFFSMTGHLLMSAMRTRQGDDADFKADLEGFVKSMNEFRQKKQDSDYLMDEFEKQLFFGTKPSTSQTEEPER